MARISKTMLYSIGESGHPLLLPDFRGNWKWSSTDLSNSLPPPWTVAHQAPLWDSPGKNTGMGYHFLLQEIFPTQVSNLGLPHCKQTLYHLSHQGSSAVKFSPLRIIFAMGLLYMAFIILKSVASMPAFRRLLIINGCLSLSMAFSAYIDIIMFFFF